MEGIKIVKVLPRTQICIRYTAIFVDLFFKSQPIPSTKFNINI